MEDVSRSFGAWHQCKARRKIHFSQKSNHCSFIHLLCFVFPGDFSICSARRHKFVMPKGGFTFRPILLDKKGLNCSNALFFTVEIGENMCQPGRIFNFHQCCTYIPQASSNGCLPKLPKRSKLLKSLAGLSSMSILAVSQFLLVLVIVSHPVI